MDAEKLQGSVSNSIKNFETQYVISTDRTGCEYRFNIRRSLSYNGEKAVEDYLEDFNKVTHNYTAQYALTAAGIILPQVSLCMQGAKGDFGHRVPKTVKALTNQCKNVFITASKSGNLTTHYIADFVDNIINKFILRFRFWERKVGDCKSERKVYF
ncbi:hypothetical protein K0M31_015998 [Melipona bicolor]|uniref:Uncharacterized protein n=1 Tax=Melipona bicolor TaxID=60889 RepID=A0AA40KT19_9HYME|nr:hypothetical protein K0M31_015998 [Melipona bicolor]